MRPSERLLQKHVGALSVEEDKIWDLSTNSPGGRSWHLSVLFRTTISPFQDYPFISRTFIEAGVAQTKFRQCNGFTYVS